jgi:hypothetical protein
VCNANMVRPLCGVCGMRKSREDVEGRCGEEGVVAVEG